MVMGSVSMIRMMTMFPYIPGGQQEEESTTWRWRRCSSSAPTLFESYTSNQNSDLYTQRPLLSLMTQHSTRQAHQHHTIITCTAGGVLAHHIHPNTHMRTSLSYSATSS